MLDPAAYIDMMLDKLREAGLSEVRQAQVRDRLDQPVSNRTLVYVMASNIEVQEQLALTIAMVAAGEHEKTAAALDRLLDVVKGHSQRMGDLIGEVLMPIGLAAGQATESPDVD